MNIRTYDDFKAAVTTAVESKGETRCSVARRLEQQGALRAHTVMCLLSTAPVIGRRKPTFDSVLKIADAAGFDLTLTPKEPA
jgi:hypothetical protein